MKITLEGREWDLDLHGITLKQGVAIHYAYGWNINELMKALPELDARAYHAAYWIMRQQAGEKIALDDADGPMVDFMNSFNDAKLDAREQREADEAQAREDAAAAVPTSLPQGDPQSPESATPTDTTQAPQGQDPALTGS